MITLIKSGIYKLIETKKDTKVLYLDQHAYAWITSKDIGEILIVSHKAHKTDCLLSVGDYRLYSVHDEVSLTDLNHLELEAGAGLWQGYLLPTGLPDDQKKRSRVIPTPQLINEPVFQAM